jgi:dihydroflavonol-4-reductase
MRSMKAALVTGATGFLGSEIARQLAERGVGVVALSRSGSLPGDLQAIGVRAIRGDLDDTAALASAMRGVDAVFHVAADVGMWRRRWAESVRVNVLGTRNMVEAALAAGAPRFVLTSSGSTIGKPLGPRTGGVPVLDERSAYNLAPLQMVYPHTKWLGEQEALRGFERGLPVVVTHPCAIFGPRDWKLNVLPLFRAAKRGISAAAPGGLRTTCDVRDVARGHIEAAERGRPGERYILGGECVPVREIFRVIAEATGGRAPLFTLPDGLVRAVGAAMETIADITGRASALTWETALQSTFRVELSSAKAARELGYASRPLADSVRDAADWYRSQGLL